MHICAQCMSLFVPDNKRGRPSAFCSKPCRNRHFYEKRVQATGRPYASCAKPMSVTGTSAPEGLARCLPCRRLARGLAPDELYRDALKAGLLNKHRGPKRCEWCRGDVLEQRRYKYCSAVCAQAARAAKGHGFSRVSKSAAARGYGAEHQKLRVALLPMAYGTPCHLCGHLMEEGDELHLDHTPDRTGYRGFAHALCNYRDGARRARQKQLEKVLREGWRPGQDPGTRRRRTRVAV